MDSKQVAQRLIEFADQAPDLQINLDTSHGPSPIGAVYLVLTASDGVEYEVTVKPMMVPFATHYHVSYPDGTEQTIINRQSLRELPLPRRSADEYAVRACHLPACLRVRT